ncbi:nitrite reductase [Paenibacillus sp. VTT E-133280]|jgi:nitrite reductase (NADH) small subunit|uniref:nitrite reductase (NAD(P)H) small subunit n=1 Tax=Paenibacillus sp. VTT E-133280 TaxID=1986222 RepID=UPI000BA01E28|nr:nitrite reductase (NAD(P)H) small subunit [Paenibacillus sp. VTT E-133280]OZQ61550.1 nitrite reductase [Paenibacillus sp. VTT E-133280]
MNKTTQTYAIGSVQDLLLQIGRVVVAGNVELAVFRTSDGAIYALENRSPHPKGGPLAEGIVSGHFLYDPLYDWKIDLRTGEVQAPDQGIVVTYPVSLAGDIVTVSL